MDTPITFNNNQEAYWLRQQLRQQTEQLKEARCALADQAEQLDDVRCALACLKDILIHIPPAPVGDLHCLGPENLGGFLRLILKQFPK